MISAMIRYGSDNGRRIRNMTGVDVQYAKTYFDSVLMETFQYHWPSDAAPAIEPTTRSYSNGQTITMALV
jgi:hypothetical protein